MMLSFQIAVRYLKAPFASISNVSRLALLGLALSVAVLIVVISVVNGFERELRLRVLSLVPHLTITAANGFSQSEFQKVNQLSQVLGAAEVVERSVIIVSQHQIVGANLLGINPASFASVADFSRFTHSGDIRNIRTEKFGIILGAGLAKDLGVGPGEQVRIVMAGGSVTPIGFTPRQKNFTVIDIVDSQSQFDAQTAFVRLKDAQTFFRMKNKVDALHIKTADLFNLQEPAQQIYDSFQNKPVSVVTWMRTYGNYYQAIAVQKITMFVILSFLVAVAAFNLVSGLIMIVEQRQADMAVMRTIGASTSTLVWAFVIIGIALAGVGIMFGAVVGVALAKLLPGFFLLITSSFGLDLMSQYFVSYLPSDVRGFDVLLICLIALCMSIVSMIYPARRAAALSPSQVLAHE